MDDCFKFGYGLSARKNDQLKMTSDINNHIECQNKCLKFRRTNGARCKSFGYDEARRNCHMFEKEFEDLEMFKHKNYIIGPSLCEKKNRTIKHKSK